MTREYTHTGKTAAIDAANGLPFVLGEVPKTLAAPVAADGKADGAMVRAAAVLTLADKLTAKRGPRCATKYASWRGARRREQTTRRHVMAEDSTLDSPLSDTDGGVDLMTPHPFPVEI